MSDFVTDTSATDSLVSPVEALRQGFQFEGSEAGATALSAAYRAAAAAGPSSTADVLQREGFRIGDLALMIRYEDGSELADLPPTYRLPNAPDWFVGVANLHGLLVPVFDLATYLGIARNEAAKPMLLVLGHGIDAAGVVVDGLPERLRIRREERADGAPIPSGLEGSVTQTYWAHGMPWMDLNAMALLNKLSDELAGTNQ